MKNECAVSAWTVNETQLEKVRDAVKLLERHLDPAERNATADVYQLDWYRKLQTRVCRREDIEHFRRFVDEMCERAAMRAQRTQVLFPSPTAGSGIEAGPDFEITRARLLCESFCASLDGDAEND